MKYMEHRTVDKSEWGDGEWQQEPDKVQYVDDATGMPCLIVRGPVGALCGYVGVDKNHPYFKKDYNHDDVSISCHHGLTFSGLCQEGSEDHGICHTVEDGEDDVVWWLGFDCAHFQDLCPKMESYINQGKWGATYKNIDFVKEQNANIARQLSDLRDAQS